MAIEESLKTTADALKKQLKDEAHARTVLQVSEDNTPLLLFFMVVGIIVVVSKAPKVKGRFCAIFKATSMTINDLNEWNHSNVRLMYAFSFPTRQGSHQTHRTLPRHTLTPKRNGKK